MTAHDDLSTLRRYTRQEAATLLNVPETWLKDWVTAYAVPHQRSGTLRGVWFTYADIVEMGRMLPDLMTGRQANHRAETPSGTSAAKPVAFVDDTQNDAWEQFAGLRSLRTSA